MGVAIGVETTGVKSVTGGERLDSTPNKTLASGNLKPRSRVDEICEWKMTKRKHQR